MKNYIGTKRIEAEPMTRGDYNKYRGWTIPADKNPEDEGYFEETYSEIGENPLYDTALLMKSNDFKDRFRAEYYQLKIRANGLKTMLKKYKNNTLPFKPNCTYKLLFTQLVYMENYIIVLEERAKVEDIEL